MENDPLAHVAGCLLPLAGAQRCWKKISYASALVALVAMQVNLLDAFSCILDSCSTWSRVYSLSMLALASPKVLMFCHKALSEKFP